MPSDYHNSTDSKTIKFHLFIHVDPPFYCYGCICLYTNSLLLYKAYSGEFHPHKISDLFLPIGQGVEVEGIHNTKCRYKLHQAHTNQLVFYPTYSHILQVFGAIEVSVNNGTQFLTNMQLYKQSKGD